MKNIKGDAVHIFKEDNERCLLIHQVNCQGVMGSGIARQIKSEFPKHYNDYVYFTNWYSRPLGDVVSTFVNFDGKCIAGVFGQENYGRNKKRYTNYAALIAGIDYILCDKPDYESIYIPKYIGCGLGGGDWNVVELLLKDIEDMYNIEFTVVEF